MENKKLYSQENIEYVINNPVDIGRGAFSYHAENGIENGVDIFNAKADNIFNRLSANGLRAIGTVFGGVMPDYAKEELELGILRSKQNYLDTEEQIQDYLTNYTSGLETVALGIASMAYEGLVDPHNQLVNLPGMLLNGGPISSFFVNFGADAIDYMAATNFFHDRNVLEDPKAEDALNLGMMGAMSALSLGIEGKYKSTDNTPLYDETNNFKGMKEAPIGRGEEPEISKEVVPLKKAPLDYLVDLPKEKPELLETMKKRGYNTLIDPGAMKEVGVRQSIGQPQGNYNKGLTREGLTNFVEIMHKPDKQMKMEKYNNANFNKDITGVSGKQQINSTLNIVSETSINAKALDTNFEILAQDIYKNTQRELASVLGYGSHADMGEMLDNVSKNLNRNTLVDALHGRAEFVDATDNTKGLYDIITRESNEHFGSLGLDPDTKKAYINLNTTNKHLLQADIIKATNENNVEWIQQNVAPYVGQEVYLDKTTAMKVGLPYDEAQQVVTIKKGRGTFEDVSILKNDLRTTKVEKNIKDLSKKRLKEISVKEKELTDTTKRKIKNLKKQATVKVDEFIRKEEIKGIKTNKKEAFDKLGDTTKGTKKGYGILYNEEIKKLNTEKETKIKNLKKLLKDTKKEETKIINEIQNHDNLYDPDKLPYAKKYQKAYAKKIKDIENEINKVTKEYETKTEKLNSDYSKKKDFLGNKESNLKNKTNKEIGKYNQETKAKLEKEKARINKKIEKQVADLEKQLEKEIKKLKRTKDPELEKHKKVKKLLDGMNDQNKNKVLKELSKYTKDYEDIKTLTELVEGNGKRVTANRYSISEYPIEVARAFENDLHRTDMESMKRYTGTTEILRNKDTIVTKAYDPEAYKQWHVVAEEWGNKVSNGKKIGNGPQEQLGYDSMGNILPGEQQIDMGADPVDMFMQFTHGYEKDTYEIIGDILSNNAEQKMGLGEVLELVSDLEIGDGKYSKNFTPQQQEYMRSFDSETRKAMIDALRAIYSKHKPDRSYKPNYWIDPHQQAIDSSMLRKAWKGFMSWKFLANLNFAREFSQNEFRRVKGARRLGWKTNYQGAKSYMDIVRVTKEVATNHAKIKAQALDSIADPVVKRRMEIYLDKNLSNRMIYNDPTDPMFSPQKQMAYKGAQKVSKGLETAGNVGAKGQLLSDVHRVANAEFGAVNYMSDILETADSPLLRKVLESNGMELGGNKFYEMIDRIHELGDEGLMELVFSGKRTGNDIDYKIQSLHEQFSDIMGKEFNAFQKADSGVSIGGSKQSFLVDNLMMFKRYSFSALEGFIDSFTKMIDEDGFTRNRFSMDYTAKENMQNVFRGRDKGMIIPFTRMAIDSSLTYLGGKWAMGKITGGADDEIAEARLSALTSAEGMMSFMVDSVADVMTGYIGLDIASGGTVLGGLVRGNTQSLKRALTSDTVPPEEGLALWGASFLAPSRFSKGIDYIKFNKNIPTRLTSLSEDANINWKLEYRKKAQLEQLEGRLPYEINWGKFFANRPDVARELTNSPEHVDDVMASVGATAMVETLEQTMEMGAIAEQMSEEPETRNKNLKAMGLDQETLLKRIGDTKEIELALNFTRVEDEQEILITLYQYLKSKDREGFIESMMSEEEMKYFEEYKKNM